MKKVSVIALATLLFAACNSTSDSSTGPDSSHLTTPSTVDSATVQSPLDSTAVAPLDSDAVKPLVDTIHR